MKSTNRLLLTVLLLWLALPLMADGSRLTAPSGTSAWYVGLQGGVPFGVSTFSAFGHDQTHAGFVGGIYGGYRFHPVVSLEAFAKWGTMALTAQACCVDNHLWLGADGNRYNVPVLDMDGWHYSDLHSQVFTQHYGVQLNINLLGCFPTTRDSRWTLEVSPLLAAVITKAEVTNQADGTAVRNSLPAYGVGTGGNIQVSYQVSKHINVGLYSGITYLTGKSFDGMPDCPHRANYIWETGIRLACTFGAIETRTKSHGEAPSQTNGQNALAAEPLSPTTSSELPNFQASEPLPDNAASDTAQANSLPAHGVETPFMCVSCANAVSGDAINGVSTALSDVGLASLAETRIKGVSTVGDNDSSAMRSAAGSTCGSMF